MHDSQHTWGSCITWNTSRNINSLRCHFYFDIQLKIYFAWEFTLNNENMHPQTPVDGFNQEQEFSRIIRPLLIAMELLGGWLYPPKKWGIAYMFRNVYSVLIILFSVWPVIKVFLLFIAKEQLTFNVLFHMTSAALHITGFVNAMLSYTRYSSIPNFIHLVAKHAWPNVHLYRKRCHVLIRFGIVMMVLLMVMNNFSWVAFNISDIHATYAEYTKPFDMSNMSIWSTLLVISFTSLPIFLSFLYNGIFFTFASWVLYKSFKQLAENILKQNVDQCLRDYLDLYKRKHFELTQLVAALDSICAGYIGTTVLMFTFNCCLITYILSVSDPGVQLYSSFVILMMSVGFFIPTLYASDKLHNAVSLSGIVPSKL